MGMKFCCLEILFIKVLKFESKKFKLLVYKYSYPDQCFPNVGTRSD